MGLKELGSRDTLIGYVYEFDLYYGKNNTSKFG